MKMTEETKLTQMLLTTMVTSENMKWSFLSGGDGGGRDTTVKPYGRIILDAFHWLILACVATLLLILVYRRRNYYIHTMKRAKQGTFLQDQKHRHDYHHDWAESITDDDDDEWSSREEAEEATFLVAARTKSKIVDSCSTDATSLSGIDETATASDMEVERGEKEGIEKCRKLGATIDELSDSNITQELPNRQKSMDNNNLYVKIDENTGRKLEDHEPVPNNNTDSIKENDAQKETTKDVIFHGWLSKQSRKHWYLWQNRYFEIYNDGNVTYYPKGVSPDDPRFGVRLYKHVQWSKMANNIDGKNRSNGNKLELTSTYNHNDNKCVLLGKVKLSKKQQKKKKNMVSDNVSVTMDDWLAKGNSWM